MDKRTGKHRHPEKIWILKNDGRLPLFSRRPDPDQEPENYQEWVREDLPKEVDTKKVKNDRVGVYDKKYCEDGWPDKINYEDGWNDCIDHLVALGVIKDKGV